MTWCTVLSYLALTSGPAVTCTVQEVVEIHQQRYEPAISVVQLSLAWVFCPVSTPWQCVDALNKLMNNWL